MKLTRFSLLVAAAALTIGSTAQAQEAVDPQSPVMSNAVLVTDGSSPDYSRYFQRAQYGAVTCYAQNSLGFNYNWVGPNVYVARSNVMALCQQNTPYGYVCWITGCV